MRWIGLILFEEIIRFLARRYFIKPTVKMIEHEESAEHVIKTILKPFVKFYFRMKYDKKV